MKRYATLGAAIFPAAVLVAAAMNGLHAQDRKIGVDVTSDNGGVIKAVREQAIAERKTASCAFQPHELPVPARDTGSYDTPALAWPVKGLLVLDLCSGPSGRYKGAIDIAAPEGTVVRAAADGWVVYAGNEIRRLGLLVLIRHRHGWVTAYAGNGEALVKRGEHVQQGRPIAVVGQVDTLKSPRLRFEIRKNSEPRDPMDYLPGKP